MAYAGTIKKLFEEKGFGFITPADGSEDVFAHFKECPELAKTQSGDAVIYDTQYNSQKGKIYATNLHVSSGVGRGGGGKGVCKASFSNGGKSSTGSINGKGDGRKGKGDRRKGQSSLNARLRRTLSDKRVSRQHKFHQGRMSAIDGEIQQIEEDIVNMTDLDLV